MQHLSLALHYAVILILIATSVSAQRSQSRNTRTRPEKCDRGSRCSDYDGESNYRSSADDRTEPPILDDKEDSKSPDDLSPKHLSGGYLPRPPVIKPPRDDYVPKDEDKNPSGYLPRPPIKPPRDDYVPKDEDKNPGGYLPRPPIKPPREDYSPKDEDKFSGGYLPRPPIKPPRDDYVPKDEDRNPGGYVPRPPVKPPRDDYVPEDKDVYLPRPPIKPIRDDYVPDHKDIYLPRPKPPRDDYVPKDEDRNPGVYVPRPPIKPPRDDYVPIVEDRYDVYVPVRPDRKPVVWKPDDYDRTPAAVPPKPVRDFDKERPRITGGGYLPRPQQNKNPSGNRQPKPKENPRPFNPDRKDIGGYEMSKDDDYDDDYKVGTDPVGPVRPVPVMKDRCICVPYYQCKDGHIVTDGAGIIDARKWKDADDELPLDGKSDSMSCGPFHVCCSTPETSTVKPYEHRCGVRNPSGINSRILSPSNKGEADFGEWPWQAAVLKAEGKVNIFQCGGVLIDRQHVITVAHCVYHLYKYNEYPLKVRLGEWDTQTTTEFLAHEDYRVSKILVHPEFKNASLWNDIAILKLEEPVLYAPHVDTVCLPKWDELFDGQNCVVTGWGKDAYKGGSFSNVMKEVALQVIDNYKCEEMLRKTRLGRFYQLHEGFLCAGGEYGLDSCKGDGGGPLVCHRKDKSYALAGIVSWGIDCGQPGVPGVYVKIQKYLDWISKSTGVDLQDYWPKSISN